GGCVCVDGGAAADGGDFRGGGGGMDFRWEAGAAFGHPGVVRYGGGFGRGVRAVVFPGGEMEGHRPGDGLGCVAFVRRWDRAEQCAAGHGGEFVSGAAAGGGGGGLAGCVRDRGGGGVR